MKKTLKLTTMLLGFALIFGTSCKKYEEGPALSLRSKKARVANTWVIEEYSVNDIKQDLSLFSDFEQEFTKDGKYTAKWGPISSEGTWEFGDKKETLKTKDASGDVTTSTIVKLKNNEMWLRTTTGSNTEETHYKSK